MTDGPACRVAVVVASLSVVCLAACTEAMTRPGGGSVEHYPVRGDAPLPFSEAVRVGELLFLSGQIGTRGTRFDQSTLTDIQVVPGGIEAETRQTMENIREVLERHGSGLAQVVKCTMMLENMADWQVASRVYASYFDRSSLPARSALGADGLALGALVEIECVATIARP